MVWNLPLPFQFIDSDDRDSFYRIPKGSTAIPLAPHPGAFGVMRKFDVHAGLDFYCPEGTPVCAVEDGTVVSIRPFTGTSVDMPWWRDTDVVMVEGKSGVVFYGEVSPSSDLKEGMRISAGQGVGENKRVLINDKGRPLCMLHLELHKHGTRIDPLWPHAEGISHAETKPASILDPTPFMLEAARNALLNTLHKTLKEIVSRAQTLPLARQEQLKQTLGALENKYPRLDQRQCAEILLNNAEIIIPAYSPLEQPLVSNVPVVIPGASTLCYGADPQDGSLSIVLIQRSEKDHKDQHLYGIPGGYINPGFYSIDKDSVITPHYGEQPCDAAIRENYEELTDGQGHPLLSLNSTRLAIIKTGIDDSFLSYGRLPVLYTIFAVELSNEEMRLIHEHSNRMQNDTAYRRSVYTHSRGEITNVTVMNLEKAAQLSSEQFKYHHSLQAIQMLHDRTTQQPQAFASLLFSKPAKNKLAL